MDEALVQHPSENSAETLRRTRWPRILEPPIGTMMRRMSVGHDRVRLGFRIEPLCELYEESVAFSLLASPSSCVRVLRESRQSPTFPVSGSCARAQNLRRVENGLLTANAIRGRPVKGLSLAESARCDARSSRSSGRVLRHVAHVTHPHQCGANRRQRSHERDGALRIRRERWERVAQLLR